MQNRLKTANNEIRNCKGYLQITKKSDIFVTRINNSSILWADCAFEYLEVYALFAFNLSIHRHLNEIKTIQDNIYVLIVNLMRKIKLLFAAAAMLLSAMAFGQNLTVRGVVTDATTGEPVPFAAIQLQGTMTGTSTDADGAYSIQVPSTGTLVFSSVGYTTQNVPVQGRASINVALEPDAEFIDETIVVAYGTATKSSFTGSAAMVKSEEIEKKITTSVTNALAGAAPGVQIVSSTGDPTSSSPTIRIRGVGSYLVGDRHPSPVPGADRLRLPVLQCSLYQRRQADGVQRGTDGCFFAEGH